MKKIFVAFTLGIIFITTPSLTFAHPGDIDDDGGHYYDENKFWTYHYHHGYPEHKHSRRICPYYAAEIAYSTSYPWEYELFLDEYVDGFEAGMEEAFWIGTDDGEYQYKKREKSYDNDYSRTHHKLEFETPFSYGFQEGFSTLYPFYFAEGYNSAAIDDNNSNTYDVDSLEKVPESYIYSSVATERAEAELEESLFVRKLIGYPLLAIAGIWVVRFFIKLAEYS